MSDKQPSREWMRTKEFCDYVLLLRSHGYTRRAIAQKAKEKFNLISCHESTISLALKRGEIKFSNKS